jgi:hypothetical protein
MSAIGKYALVNRQAWQRCLAAARSVRPETTGKWLWKKTQVVGVEEFDARWREAVVRNVDFDYSGYVLGNYLDAQESINETRLVDEQSDDLRILSTVFTAAFPFEMPVPLPELPLEKLVAYCREEYDNDADGMIEAITAAHAFYRQGLAEITSEHMVVFLII